jgi:predicted AlkP superfamily phosphohydrolase/phosphomutase
MARTPAVTEPEERVSVGSGPLVILGIDAGDPEFLQRWTREGHLPTLAGIMERGSWGRTGGPELISEHGVWVSLFSGIPRRDHGYYYYRQLRPGSYELETVTGLDVDALPFWTRIDPGGRRALVIDIPDYDPVPGIPGVQLTHWATHNNWDPDHFVTAAEPAEVLADVSRRFAPRLVTVENHESTSREDRAILDELLARISLKGAACRHLLDRGPFDVVAVVFAESHTANHQFWRYQPGLNGAGDDPALVDGIRDVYRAIDRELGLLLERLPAESDVVVVSSVGMEDDFPANGLIEAFCRGFGYQVSPESSGSPRPTRPIDWVRWAVPERWRIALSRRLSRETRERLLADRFRASTDWTRTRAFPIPSPYTSFVRVNLRGREPSGIVEPGAEYEALLTGIESDLATLVDPESGDPAVVRTTRTTEAFGCGPHPTLPDLWVEWRPGRFLTRVVHPGGELVQGKPDFFRRSDHCRSGFFAAAGPSIAARGDVGEIDVLDLAPTFLALIGEPPAERMTGRPLRSLFAG